MSWKPWKPSANPDANPDAKPHAKPNAKPSTPYFLISGLCFLAAAGSAIVDGLGPPLVFGFATLCSVFLAFGALAAKDPDPVRARRGEDSEGAP